MTVKKTLLYAACFLSLSVYAYTLPIFPDNYRSAHFRLYYDNSSPKALDYLPAANRVDKAPRNGTPDFIEAVAQKLEAALLRYTDAEFNLQSPFDSPRYQDKLAYIGVSVEALERQFGINGLAGDAVVYDQFRRTLLSIEIDHGLSSSSLTPEHELFHEVQNGYSMFTNSWYTEGSARWAERAFKDISSATTYQTPLPATPQALTELMAKSYAAETFWNRISYLCDADSPANNPAQAEKVIYGTVFMRGFLENLALASRMATTDRCHPPFTWDADEQSQNADNNRYILAALKQSVLAQCPVGSKQSVEVSAFLRAVDAFIAQGLKIAYFDSSQNQLCLPMVAVNGEQGSKSYYRAVLQVIPNSTPLRLQLTHVTALPDFAASATTASFQAGVLEVPQLAIADDERYGLPTGQYRVNLLASPLSNQFELHSLAALPE